MKTSNKLLLIAMLVIAVLIISALVFIRVSFDNEAIEKKSCFWKRVVGDGNIIEKTFDVKNFDKLNIIGGFEVSLTQDTFYSVTIITDSNVMDLVDVEIKNDELIVKRKKGARKTVFKADIVFKNLNTIKMTAGVILKTTSAIKVDDLSVYGNAGTVLSIDGIFDKMVLDVNAGAVVNLSGKANILKINSNAGCLIDAVNMETTNCDIESNAGCKIDVFVTDKLSVDANAGSSISYLGNPEIRNINLSSGSILKQR